MEHTVLLVVDVQTALVTAHPYKEESVVRNIKSLIETARQQKMEVVYVRHDGGKGDELEYGTDGWQIYKEIAPDKEEKIFDKSYNSAFRQTRLHEYLQEKGIETIILAGMQTEYCIDTTCKVAFEYGYQVLIGQETTTTFDNSYATGEQIATYYERKIWDKRFASVLPLEELQNRIRK